MTALCRRLAAWIGEGLSLSEERRLVVEYGLMGLMQMAAILAAAVFLGAVFGFVLEAVVIFFAVGLLRRNTGGVHAQTMAGCTLMSVGVVVLLAALCRYGLGHIGSRGLLWTVQAFFYGVSVFQIYRKAPMDTPNKPITKPEKIRRLRLRSFYTLGLYAALSSALLLWGGNRGVSLTFAVGCAMLWQVFTLTRLGAVFVHAADRLFSGTLKKERGGQ